MRGFARQREDALEKLWLFLLLVEDLAQIFQPALLLLLGAFRRFLELMRSKRWCDVILLVAGEQLGVVAQGRDEGVNSRLGRLGECDLIVALVGRE